jgi:hypothetical protein
MDYDQHHTHCFDIYTHAEMFHLERPLTANFSIIYYLRSII